MKLRLYARQRQIAREAKRFNVADNGRRFGKSLFGVDLLSECALDGHPVAWFAPTYKYLKQAWRDTKKTLALVIRGKDESEHRLELLTGGVLEFWTLGDENAGRSRKYKRVIIDEAALSPKLLEIWNAAISPTLMDLHGDAYIFSTPKGRNGFWQMYQWGLDPHMPDWACWQFPTSANPYIDPAEIASLKARLPERIYQQEVLAQFLEDAGGVFRRVMAAATLPETNTPIADHQYVMGVDWGKSEDFTVITVWDVTTQHLVALDRFNQIDYRVQRQRLGAMHERWAPTVIMAETNAMGEPIIEQLRADSLPVRGFTTTNATKAAIIEALSLAFERDAIRIVNDPVLIGELQAYEMTRLPSGNIRYGAPEGMHDDTVMAAAIGYHAAAQPAPSSLFAAW